MVKLLYASDDFLREFKKNFDNKYIELYKRKDKSSIEKIFYNKENVYESTVDFEYEALKFDEKLDGLNFHNVKTIYKCLGHISPSVASSEKLWVALENTYYLDFHLNQITMNTSENNEDDPRKVRTVFTRGKKRSLILNNLAELWWIGFYTIDSELKNPFVYAKYLFEKCKRGDFLLYFSSKIVSNKEIAIGTISAIIELENEGKIKVNRYSFVNANKILNQIGGVTVLEILNREEIKEIIKNRLNKTNNL